MANTKSAEKALRQSNKKRINNLYWKKRMRTVMKSLDKSMGAKNAGNDILIKEQATLQGLLDKAAKNKVIHKNKANRIKARYAKKLTVQAQTKGTAKTGTKSKARTGKSKS